jgi:DNA-binding NtrC family response regulator
MLRGTKGEVPVHDECDALVLQMYHGGILYREAVREFKKAFITIALQEHNGNLSRSAPKLGLHRNTLSRAVAELDVNVGALRPVPRRPPARASSAPRERKVSR